MDVPNPDPPVAPDTSLREALRRRIDEEIAGLETPDVSSWMMAQPPGAETDDGRVIATEVEIDAALGALFWRAHSHLPPQNSFHVIGSDSRLVAVLTPGTGALSVRERVALEELATLELHRRPIAAGTPPPAYRSTHLAAILWRFALHGTQSVEALPDPFRTQPMRLRQLPPLDRTLVAGRHFKLMQLLHEGSRTFQELLDATGLSDKQLGRDLTALLLVGCLVLA